MTVERLELERLGTRELRPASPAGGSYHRYHLETKPAPDVAPFPNRFRVQVKRHRLALLLLREFIHYRGNMKAVLSRPCVYGVFSGPIGGFAPRPQFCVGCLSCTTQYPDVVQVYHNPERRNLGDSYFTPTHVDAVSYEAQTGRIPVKGAGYRGPFGGEGWDGMWTDMSEIVRPTRDGIHGREFISTAVDLGGTRPFFTFDSNGLPTPSSDGRAISLPVPILFDLPPDSVASRTLFTVLGAAAREAATLAILPAAAIKAYGLSGPHLVPLVGGDDRAALSKLDFQPRMVELAEWDENLFEELCSRFPTSVVGVRVNLDSGFEGKLLDCLRAGARVFHLTADYHGRSGDGRFVLDLIRAAHHLFVERGLRDEVTLIGSGGIIAAEHVPKAIICGLDAVALDTPLLVALQAKLQGECADRRTSRFDLPALQVEWGTQRLLNLAASWRDQLLEVLGAMGLREVRRLRGEIGRAIFQKDMEREAFGGISGYAD